jgi:hypothetical protein
VFPRHNRSGAETQFRFLRIFTADCAVLDDDNRVPPGGLPAVMALAEQTALPEPGTCGGPSHP